MLRSILLAGLLCLSLLGTAQPAPSARLVSLPFDVVAGVLVLRNLTFNGRQGDFILDTGCAYALLVEQTAFPNQLRPSATRALGRAGAVTLSELPVTQFEFGQIRPPQVAQATSLAALRSVVGPRLLGLIGTGLLRRYEVVIDYAHRRLSCYALGFQQSLARPFVRRDSVAFTLAQDWPVTVAYVGTVPVQLLLDTGATDNHLDAELAEVLPVGTRPTGAKRERVLGLGGHSLAARRAMLPRLQVGAREWHNVPMVLAPAARYYSGRALPYQGILGGTFLSQEPLVSFHFGRHQFYTLSPRRP